MSIEKPEQAEEETYVSASLEQMQETTVELDALSRLIKGRYGLLSSSQMENINDKIIEIRREVNGS